jgi:hypothetical protein
MGRRITVLLISTLMLLAPAGVAGAAGVTGPAFYVDGVLYRTVLTPTDLSGTGAPAHTFDTIYEFFGLQPNVADAAPGMPGYNGGRWEVRGLEFADYEAAVALADANGSGDLDSQAELMVAMEAGLVTDLGVIARFVCPVIKVPPRR